MDKITNLTYMIFINEVSLIKNYVVTNDCFQVNQKIYLKATISKLIINK